MRARAYFKLPVRSTNSLLDAVGSSRKLYKTRTPIETKRSVKSNGPSQDNDKLKYRIDAATASVVRVYSLNAAATTMRCVHRHTKNKERLEHSIRR